MASDEKKKALDAAIAKLEKDFGKGTVMKLGEGSHVAVETVPTGCLSLDLALGLGGVPKGRVIEVYGPESSGKTTVTLHMIAEVQKRGGIAGFIDAEHALDPVYAKKIGVDIDELYISQPDSGKIRSDGYHRSGFGCCAGTKAGDRRRYGRQSCRPAGETDVAGTA